MDVDAGILYLGASDVTAALGEVDVVAAVRDALALHARGETCLPHEAYLGWTAPSGGAARSLNMPGYLGDGFGLAGTKIINGCLDNPSKGLPRANGLTLLFDPETARIVCIMAAGEISALRTAAVTALATELLVVRPIGTAAIVGAGTLAEAHLRLLPHRFPDLDRIALYDLDEQRANDLAARVQTVVEAAGAELVLAPSAREAIAGARLVVPVTTTTEGYVGRDWLAPGALVVNVSLDDVLPDVVLAAGCLVVDDWELVRTDERRLLGRMAREGLVAGPGEAAGGRRVDAELGALVLGSSEGRRSDEDLVLVNPFGLAIEDLAVAMSVHEVARSRGLGTLLPR